MKTFWTRLATITGRMSMNAPGLPLRSVMNALYSIAYRRMDNPWYEDGEWTELQ